MEDETVMFGRVEEVLADYETGWLTAEDAVGILKALYIELRGPDAFSRDVVVDCD